MESRKAAIASFEKLDAKMAEKIPSIKNFPEMVATTQKQRDLEVQLKQVNQKLNDFYEGYSEGGTQRPSPEKDAELILSGAAVATLTGQSVDTEKQNLVRQKKSLELAILMQEEHRKMLESRLVSESCAEFKQWYIDTVIKPEITELKHLEKILQKKEVVNQHFSTKGYIEGYRPAGWLTTAYEQNILHGGVNLCCLRFAIEQLCKTWNIKEEVDN